MNFSNQAQIKGSMFGGIKKVQKPIDNQYRFASLRVYKAKGDKFQNLSPSFFSSYN